MNGEVIRTITIRGQSEGLDKLTADVNKLVAAEQGLAVVSEETAKRTLSLEDAWKRQTLRLDETARAQANIARETKVADAALREGLATQAQHAQRLEQINQRYVKTADATKVVAHQTGLARHELVNLGRQAQDVGVSLMSGQSPFTVLVQQGTQIADVFATSGGTIRGFFSQAIGWAKGFFTSMTGIVTVVGAVAAAAGLAAWQFLKSSTTVEEALEEQNRVMKIGYNLHSQRLLLVNNEIDLQAKLAAEMQNVARIAERKAGRPTSVAGEMGEFSGAVAALPGYEKIIAAQQTLNATVAQGQPGMQQFMATLSQIVTTEPGIKSVINELLKSGAVGVQLENAAAAAGRMTQLMLQLAQVYPGMTFETATQLQLLDAQLVVAQARSAEEKIIAQYKADIVELTGKNLSLEEATAIAAGKRAIAEENLLASLEKQAEAQQSTLPPARDLGNEQRNIGREIQRNVTRTIEWVTTMNQLAGAARTMTETLAEAVDNRLDMLQAQFAGQQFELELDPLGQKQQYERLKEIYGAENVELYVSGANTPDAVTIARVKSDYLNKDSQIRTADELIGSLDELSDSTDSLNATMQDALSPFYSQDPRTTKLGFRAGTVGNPDWMTGATNANSLVAVLGNDATAPGMANGGSFVVGGGYSANDNRMAVFPVASGEQVVVNRNREGRGGQVVNIDNRIIVTGSVDADTLSKMKVSRYQQAQRMRGQLARA